MQCYSPNGSDGGTHTALSLLPRVLILAAALLLAACAEKKASITEGQATIDFNLLLSLPEEPIAYDERVKPVLERRCVVCHACYDAPCQLKLTAHEGLTRGASKDKVYDSSRLKRAEPTRLFIDASSTAEWRDMGFHPVINESGGDPQANLENSVLYRMLRLKQRHPQARVGMVPDDFELNMDAEQQCATLDEFDDYALNHPNWGMPYAMPNLSDGEYRTLVQWLAQGSPVPSAAPVPADTQRQIDRWETFLNGASNKERLVSRYLYEHLFPAHIHFVDTPDREFYRLVRSRTPPGTPVDEIASRRPYDDPGPGPFYYRFRPFRASVAAKSHVVYELSEEKMGRYREWFLEPEYQVTTLPPYDAIAAANPFQVFQPIPPASRYRFLLDEARFFIEGFIKGSVCRGQVALNVIEDQFWLVFLDPDTAGRSLDPDFLAQMSDYLQLPAEQGNRLRLFAIWTDYWKRQKTYMEARVQDFQKVHAQDIDHALEFIWDGDGSNPNAALTVFRHFDSASVALGFQGDYPESAWVIDYPLLERIHYLLVAGFDVFGHVGHLLNTRLYMEFLRMEGEMYFLAFLPASRREAIYESWYASFRQNLDEGFETPKDWLTVESVVGYKTDDPQRELYMRLEDRLRPILADTQSLNRCRDVPCFDPTSTDDSVRAGRALSRIAQIDGDHLWVFPDVTFLRVETDGEDTDLAYTFILNKGYSSLTSAFEDEDNRDLDDDTLTVVDWLEGSYPNFFVRVHVDDIEQFVDRYAQIRERDDYERFVALYGVRRTAESYWAAADWFQDRYEDMEPIRAGLLDLNRYQNR